MCVGLKPLLKVKRKGRARTVLGDSETNLHFLISEEIILLYKFSHAHSLFDI